MLVSRTRNCVPLVDVGASTQISDLCKCADRTAYEEVAIMVTAATYTISNIHEVLTNTA